ncbi:ATP-binding cassette domain-containing protein, partial [Bacillus cereus]|uniref:ATP-binding cassette domain-containing protein n=1 Tax=Bacillus cereus TaxID=1396 RepID=UPI0021132DC7
VTLTGITHRYPSTVTPSVEDLDLHVADGEFLVLLGKAGSGKSTILRMIHGMERPQSGQISIAGQDVTAVPPTDRDVT